MSEEQQQQSENQQVKRSLLGSSLVVAVMTMLSRILGLIRDVAIAALAGATAHADAFFIAFKVPQFLRRLFAEGAFSQAFVPVLSEYQSKKPHEAVQHLVDRVCGLLGSTLIFITVLAVVGAPVITALFAPGFLSDEGKYSLTADLIRITFPYLFFISMAGFIGAILNTYHKFAVPAFTPVILNVSLITAAVYGVNFFVEPVFALAWGVFIAGLAQFLFQLPFVARINLLPKPKIDTKDEGVRKILTLMIPALFGVSVSQINLLLDTVIASFLPTGSVSWLYYSDRLVELPLGVFAIAISTVILPSLSRKFAKDDTDKFLVTMDWAMRMILLIALPATLALLILAEPILITLFFHGSMTENDMLMAAWSLRAYALGLLPFMMIKILAPGFYAQQNTKTPVKIGIIAMVANMLLNVLFVVPLHLYFQLGHVGLALATAASALLNAALLLQGLKKIGRYQVQTGFWLVSAKYVLAAVLMSLALFALHQDIAHWFAQTAWSRVVDLLVLVLVGGGVYFLALLLQGVRPRDFHAAA